MTDFTEMDQENSVATIDNKTKELADRILVEDNIDALKDLTTLFNLNIARKNVLRVLKLNDLYDKVSDNIVKRFETTPGEFSNDDLIRYMTTIEGSIEKAQKQLGKVEDPPLIQINQQNNVNINVDSAESLSREERERVMNTIKLLLESGETQELSPEENQD